MTAPITPITDHLRRLADRVDEIATDGLTEHVARRNGGDDEATLREAAKSLRTLTAIASQLSVRQVRVFEAFTTLDLPDGWVADIVGRSGEDPFAYGIRIARADYSTGEIIVPSTDGTPRWYNSYLRMARGGMSDDAQAAVDYVIGHDGKVPER